MSNRKKTLRNLLIFCHYICSGKKLFRFSNNFKNLTGSLPIINSRWMTPFLLNGAKNELKKEDLYKVLSEDESQVLGDKLER